MACMLLISSFCQADFADHLQKDSSPRSKEKQLAGIDYIYFINLDKSQDRRKKCMAEFEPYQIFPHRFPAVNGYALSPQVLNEVGVKFNPKMQGSEWVLHFPSEKNGAPEYDFLRDASFGKTVFFRYMTPGGIGCALSHISVLQDAYDAGYETIWVMEDDVAVKQDPHVLSALITKLDALVGKDGWDILYTDTDFRTQSIYPEEEDMESDLKSDLWFCWRPDLGLNEQKRIAKRTILSDDFVQIGGRIGAYSLIVRRSGMKKILDFEKEHHIFIPYDHELATIPNLKMFNLRYDLVTVAVTDSWTDFNAQQNRWGSYKQATLAECDKISGWKHPQMAEKIMEFLHDKRPNICVEIGTFGGASAYPIAKTLSFLNRGVVYAIDAWDVEAAVEGLESAKRISWWKTIDMQMLHQQVQNLIVQHQLEKYCFPIQKRSNQAVQLFKDGSVDFLFLDGNESEKGSLEDALLYYPKVKEGGYIWLNGTKSTKKNQATAFLMKHCEWLKHESIGLDCLVFQKKKV